MSQKKTSYPKEKIKILLLEGIHPVALERLKESDYQAELIKPALSEKDLIAAIKGVHVLGIRSKTNVTKAVLEAAPHLLAIGCFCIGTNQVDLDTAASHGVPVFNAPFSNTRSVAELTLAEIVMLSRKAAHKSQLLHQGCWEKNANNCYEIRNKTLGIIGYGHIGAQVSSLAEAFGMRVVFFDIVPKLALGNAVQLKTLNEVLQVSDFVTLHVPETPETKNMISGKELQQFKKGAFLLNLSRGSVVDIAALRKALDSGQLEGAGIDVFPEEPVSNDDPFESELRGAKNVILTPHIGGSTEEAQHNIAIEVSSAMVKFVDMGSTTGSVNFPVVELPVVKESHRILNIHKNVPGVLRDINRVVAEMGANIRAQYLATRNDVGYMIMDVDSGISRAVKQSIEALETNIRTRLLF